MWFYNDNIALNLAKATAIDIKRSTNKFKVYAYYSEGIQERYLLNTFNTLQDAQTFIKNIIHDINTTNNTNTGTGTDNKVEYAFIELSE